MKAERIQSQLKKAPGWKTRNKKGAISRTYTLPSFRAALAFVAFVGELDAGEASGGRLQRVQHALRGIVGMGVDDHSAASVGWLAWIAASMSLMRSGSSSMRTPIGPSASLTALATAAGAPR